MDSSFGLEETHTLSTLKQNLLQVLWTRSQKRSEGCHIHSVCSRRSIHPPAYKFCCFSFHPHHSSSSPGSNSGLWNKSSSWQTYRWKVRETQTLSFHCSSEEITFSPHLIRLWRSDGGGWKCRLQQFAICCSQGRECLPADRARECCSQPLCPQGYKLLFLSHNHVNFHDLANIMRRNLLVFGTWTRFTVIVSLLKVKL